jgi:hypothetical protein
MEGNDSGLNWGTTIPPFALDGLREAMKIYSLGGQFLDKNFYLEPCEYEGVLPTQLLTFGYAALQYS